jgi:hypothetical protein
MGVQEVILFTPVRTIYQRRGDENEQQLEVQIHTGLKMELIT